MHPSPLPPPPRSLRAHVSIRCHKKEAELELLFRVGSHGKTSSFSFSFFSSFFSEFVSLLPTRAIDRDGIEKLVERNLARERPTDRARAEEEGI